MFEKDALAKIVVQLKVFVDLMLKKGEASAIDENLVILDKIT